MDEQTAKAQARLFAIEHLLRHLYVVVYRSLDLTLDDVRQVHRKAREMLRKDTYPTDAATSDVVASEIQEAVTSQLSAIEQMLELAQERSGP